MTNERNISTARVHSPTTVSAASRSSVMTALRPLTLSNYINDHALLSSDTKMEDLRQYYGHNTNLLLNASTTPVVPETTIYGHTYKQAAHTLGTVNSSDNDRVAFNATAHQTCISEKKTLSHASVSRNSQSVWRPY